MTEASDLTETSQVGETEFKEQMEKLHEAQEKLKLYEEVAEEAQHEFKEMQLTVERERQKSEKAMSIASQVYRQNTILKKSRRLSKSSNARRRWAREGKEEMRTAEDLLDQEDQQVTSPSKPDEDAEINDDVIELEIKALESGIAKADSRLLKHHLEARVDELELENSALKVKIDYHRKVEALATDELQKLQEQLDVESNVRKKAESFAAQMYGENRSWKRQSVMQKKQKQQEGISEEDTKLEKALTEIRELTEQVETLKMEHRQKVEELEKVIKDSRNLDSEIMQEEINLLKERLKTLTEEKDESDKKCIELETRLENLRSKSVTETGSTSAIPPPATMTTIPPPPPMSSIPPPPPMSSIPPPPPMFTGGTIAPSADPLQNLRKLVNERKANRQTAEGEGEKANGKTSSGPKYADAMAEMMNRIKQGNVGLKKLTRRSSESRDYPQGDEDIKHQFKLKASTLDNRTNRRLPNQESEDNNDLFDRFRNFKSDQPGPPRNRRVSEPDARHNFREVLKPRVGFQRLDEKDEEKQNNFLSGLRPNRMRNLQQRNAFQGSVRHPNEVSPELKAILDKKRMKSKQNDNIPVTNS